MKRFFFALSGISLLVAVTGCCCGSQCCGYGGGGCPNGACGVPGQAYQGAFLPGTTTIQAAAPAQQQSASVTPAPTTYISQYPTTAMVTPLPTY